MSNEKPRTKGGIASNIFMELKQTSEKGGATRHPFQSPIADPVYRQPVRNQKRQFELTSENPASATESGSYQRLVLAKKNYLSISDAARFLGVSRNTLYKIMETGGIQPIRFTARTIRVARQDLENFLPCTSPEAQEEYRAKRSLLRNADTGEIQVNPNEWYTYAEVIKMTRIRKDSIKNFCKANCITRRRFGRLTYISKKEWDAARGGAPCQEQSPKASQPTTKHVTSKTATQNKTKGTDERKAKIGNFAYFRKEEAEGTLENLPAKEALAEGTEL